MNKPEKSIPAQPFRPVPPPIRYVIDFQPPVEYRIVHRIELDPEVIELLHDIFNPELPMTKQELVDLITAATAQVTSLMDAEHAEVLAALEALKNGDVPPEVSSAVQAFLDAVKGGIPKILDVVTTPPDGGTVTPVPAPAPAPPTPPTP